MPALAPPSTWRASTCRAEAHWVSYVSGVPATDVLGAAALKFPSTASVRAEHLLSNCVLTWPPDAYGMAWRSCLLPPQLELISKGQLCKPTPCWIRAHAGEAHRLVPWHLDDHYCAPRHHLGLAQQPGSSAPASGNATLATTRGNILQAAGEDQSERAPSATDDLPAELRRVCRAPDPHGLTRV